MTQPRPRTCAASVLAVAACLLLAACGSSSPTHANTTTARSNDTTASSSPVHPTSTAGAKVGTSSPAAPAATNACALVTEKEAGAALGADPGPGRDVASHGASSCMYSTSPSLVTVNALPSAGKADYEHLRAQAPGGRVVNIAGVGDAAFATFSGPAASIDFYKGDTFVAVVLITGRAGSPPKARAIALARTAASRI